MRMFEPIYPHGRRHGMATERRLDFEPSRGRKHKAAMRDRFESYLLKLRETPLSEHTEHTGRSALQDVLDQFAKDAKSGLHVQHEPKRQQDKGAPDFKVSRHGVERRTSLNLEQTQNICCRIGRLMP